MQRNRILTAVFQIVLTEGYLDMTVQRIVARAGISRKTFYDAFADREDCFCTAFENALAGLRAVACTAYAGEGDWATRTRLALASLLAELESEPAVAALCLLESRHAGRRADELRTRVMREVAGVIERDRPQTQPLPSSELIALGVLGAALTIVELALREGNQLMPLLSPSMALIVAPYLGARAAAGERARRCPPPPRRRSSNTPSDHSLRGLRLRVTATTTRALLFVSEHPGASNREVSDGAHVSDQGQISKLLHRLKSHGLLENTGDGHAMGTSNAWHLTPLGRELVRSTRPYGVDLQSRARL